MLASTAPPAPDRGALLRRLPLLIVFLLSLAVFSPQAAFAQDDAASDEPSPTASSVEGGELDDPEAVDAAKDEVETTEEETDDDEADAAPAAPSSYDSESYGDVDDTTQLQYAFDNFVLFICAVLVLFMQAGFAMVEAGMNAAKNTVNILSKNVMDLCVGVLLYFFIGYAVMYPGFEPGDNGWFKFGSPAIGFSEGELGVSEASAGTLFPQVDFLFQAAFAATAATIVSGAVAGRMKFGAYLIYSAVLTGIIYPISGAWKWGSGFMSPVDNAEYWNFATAFGAPFHDFAGSVVVHAVGGFGGLAGAIVLGPRMGRYTADGKPNAMPGHSISMATLGVFILLIGWFGFNPGSQLVFSDAADINTTLRCATNTLLAATAGGLSALLAGWAMFKKPDLSWGLNGILGGLVGITANCDQVTHLSAIIIGLVAGLLVVFGVILLDKLKIDDPVGAWPVHGLCGVWGCLAVIPFGLSEKAAMSQILGTVIICAWAFFTMLGVFFVLKACGILRVSPEEEAAGLDVSEHGMAAYVT